MTELKRLVPTARLVTLTGTAGVGKTRLALRVAAALTRTFSDGVWLVRLSQLRDGALLAHAVAQALQIHDQRSGPLPALLDFLRDKRTLLVLDDCSHLVEACADFAATVLHRDQRVQLLVTSREILRVTGEHVFTLPPLPFADPAGIESPRSRAAGPSGPSPAATLFVERATAAVPSFSLNAENQAPVEELCRRLDGLPLAIELAAARLRVLSVAQILQRIDDRFELLGGGRRTVPAHQRTLRAAIDWSFELCTPDEQLAWRRASVFAGDFALEAAQDVCSGDGLAPDHLNELLDGLVGKSIMLREEHGDQVRFRLLETLRQYGQEALHATGQTVALGRRHADWYVRLAEQAEHEWFGPHDIEWFGRIRQEQANLRAALEFSLTNPDRNECGPRIAAALWLHWLNSGLIAEGRLWLERALALGDAPTPARGRALWAAGFVANLEADLEASVHLLEQARDVAAELGDDALAARTACWLGAVPLHRGELASAQAQLEQAWDMFTELGGRPDAHLVLSGLMLATVRLLRQDLPRALEDAQRCRAICQECGDHTYLGYALTLIARIEWSHGRPDRAVEQLQESLRLRRVHPHPPTLLAAIDLLTWIAEASGQYARAAVLLGAAQHIWRTFGLSRARSVLRVPHEEGSARTRAALGDAAYQVGYRRGMQLDVEQIIAYALREAAKPGSVGAGRTPEAPVVLTSRERQVAELVAIGLSNKQIAGRLVIAQRTAESHIEHILTKLGFTSRAEIASWVIEASNDDDPVVADCNGH
jgi:predicted ATPase/DNA-binding CsgD family transcriptional regulator